MPCEEVCWWENPKKGLHFILMDSKGKDIRIIFRGAAFAASGSDGVLPSFVSSGRPENLHHCFLAVHMIFMCVLLCI